MQRRYPALVALVAVLGEMSDGWAQSTAPVGEDKTLEEIIVTAEKRATDLQKTPASIVVISGDTITKEAKTSLGELLRDVPGVTVTGNSNNPDEIFIRGIGSSDPNNSSQVSIIIDGIANASGITGATGLAGTGISGTGTSSTANYDIAQAEVLSGPQGTRYGGSTAAGAIIINTNDPGFTNEAQGSATLGNYSKIEMTGMVNLPVSDTLAFRAAVFSTNHDGYLSNGLNDEDTQSARAKLKYQWGDDSSLVLTGEFTKTGGKGAGSANYANGQLSSDPWYSFQDPNRSNSSKTTQFRAKLDWNFGWGVLTALPSHIHVTSDNFAQQYVLPTYAHTVQNTDSLELRMSAPKSSALFWQVGGYLSLATVPSSHNFSTNNLAASPPGTLPYQNLISLKDDTNSYAAFANLSYPIINSLRVSAGLRWQRDSVDGEQLSLSGSSPTALNFNWHAYPSRTWQNVSWSAGLDYDVTAKNLLYLSAATGYAPGTVQAIQLPGATAPTINSTNSQVLTQYAIGSKNRFLNDTLQINVEGYYTVYDIYNLPRPNRQPNGSIILAIYELAGGATSKGFDASVNYLLTPHDRLNLTVAGNWASYGSQPTVPEFTDKPFLHAPVWSVSPSYQHTFALGNGAALTARADSQYQTKQIFGADYLPNQVDPAHWRSNLTIAYDGANGKWSLVGFVRNIENKADIVSGGGNATSTYTDAVNPPTPQTVVVVGSPRTFGLTLSYKL